GERGVLDATGDRAGEDGLTCAGHVLEENVAAAGERGEHEFQLFALAAQDGFDAAREPPGDLEGLARRLAVHAFHAPCSLPTTLAGCAGRRSSVSPSSPRSSWPAPGRARAPPAGAGRPRTRPIASRTRSPRSRSTWSTRSPRAGRTGSSRTRR